MFCTSGSGTWTERLLERAGSTGGFSRPVRGPGCWPGALDPAKALKRERF